MTDEAKKPDAYAAGKAVDSLITATKVTGGDLSALENVRACIKRLEEMEGLVRTLVNPVSDPFAAPSYYSNGKTYHQRRQDAGRALLSMVGRV